MIKGLRIARVYEPTMAADGVRLLVDRLWPRGLTKEGAHLDGWRTDLAPSTELRKFYGHRPERFEEFARRYEAELQAPQAVAALDEVLTLMRTQPVTLLTATRDLETSGAAVLAEHLSSIGSRRRRT